MEERLYLEVASAKNVYIMSLAVYMAVKPPRRNFCDFDVLVLIPDFSKALLCSFWHRKI